MERYKIDFANKTITITSAFAKKAANLDSAEYKLLKKLQKDFPDFSVRTNTHKTPTKYKNKNGETTVCNQFKNLTFEHMELFMEELPDNEAFLAEYRFLRETASKLQLNPYMIVRKWFCEQFPKYKSNPLFYLEETVKLIKGTDILNAEEEAAEDQKKAG